MLTQGTVRYHSYFSWTHDSAPDLVCDAPGLSHSHKGQSGIKQLEVSVLNTCLVIDTPDVSTTFTLIFTSLSSLLITSLYRLARIDPGVDGINITESLGLYHDVFVMIFFFFLSSLLKFLGLCRGTSPLSALLHWFLYPCIPAVITSALYLSE